MFAFHDIEMNGFVCLKRDGVTEYHTIWMMLRLEHCVQQVIDSYMFPGNKEEEAVLVSYLRMC